MKTTLAVNINGTSITLTPESDVEKNILQPLRDASGDSGWRKDATKSIYPHGITGEVQIDSDSCVKVSMRAAPAPPNLTRSVNLGALPISSYLKSIEGSKPAIGVSLEPDGRFVVIDDRLSYGEVIALDKDVCREIEVLITRYVKRLQKKK